MNSVTGFQIDGRDIGGSAPPYVIAELSANHNGQLDTALKIVASAKAAGADAIKLQTYRPDTITLDCDGPDFMISGGLWSGRRLYDLYQEAHMPWEWHRPLFDHARKIGITIFSSPFDSTAVDLLEELNAPAYKIASFEAVDLPLIRYVAQTRKPMIISTGMASPDEIQEAIDTARSNGCNELAILHCVSAYPADPADYNLRTIPDMARRFGVMTGLSDHTLDNSTAIASVALGAPIIEKHFTLDRSVGGPDDSFSLEPEELAALCTGVRTAWEALGSVSYSRKSGEVDNVKFRRSLYVTRDVRTGDLADPSNVRSIRPGYGLPCRDFDEVMGKAFSKDVKAGTALTWSHLSHSRSAGPL